MKDRNPFLIFSILIILLLNSAALFAQKKNEWQELFDGKTLDGWEQLNGTAKYTVEDGMIVGTTVLGSPNSFLCTKKSYGNFILELDFKADEGLNSGIQLRSQSYKEYQNGRVHGYQVEIDPAQKELYAAFPPNYRANGEQVLAGSEPRRWTGGIYDEGRRGWLNNLTHNEAARLAFKPGEWNHFRIEAIGDGIRTWINDVLASSIVDGMTPNGFIALQVHAVKQEKPLKVYWKNIRIQDLGVNNAVAETIDDSFIGDWQTEKGDLIAQIFLIENGNYKSNLFKAFDTADKPIATLEGIKSENIFSFNGEGWTGTVEKNRFKLEKGLEKFELRHITRNSPTLNAIPPKDAQILFDGSNLDEWTKQKNKEWLTPDGPVDNWKIIPGGRLEAVPGTGSIITKKHFGDFKLHAEFRLLSTSTNGGIYLMTRYEINIKDSYGQFKGDPCGMLGNVADPKFSNPVINAARPLNQWQTIDLDFSAPRFDSSGKDKTKNARITVSLNGVKIYENVEPVKMKGAVLRLGEASIGPIMLQEHGTVYQFRNIWVLESKK